MTLTSIHPTGGIAAHVGNGSVQKRGVMVEPADDRKRRNIRLYIHVSDKISISK